MRYIHQTNNTIDIAPRTLPKAWKNISGLDKATTSELKDLGWLSVIDINPPFDPDTQIRTGPVGGQIGDSVPVNADDVTVEFTVRNKTAQEFDDEKDAEATAIMTMKGLKILAKGLDDGSFVPGANIGNAGLKAYFKARL